MGGGGWVASPRTINNVIYITNLFIYSVRAVISSGLQWFARNRQKSKYPVSRHDFLLHFHHTNVSFSFVLTRLVRAASQALDSRSLKSDTY